MRVRTAPISVLWSPPKKNGRCDSINYKGEWKKRKWGNRFEAGKTFKGGYDIEAF